MLRYSTFATLLAVATPLFAQRDLKEIPPTDPEIERQSFQLPPGFEVNLYAADPLLAKPIQMNWDARGRLWIATSETYPQILPGKKADDKILVIEDTDRDGRADKTTVFVGGLLIPTGVVPGDGGAYVANSTELVFFPEEGTTGKAATTEPRVVLSGFGTEDTHHIIHSFRWNPIGQLAFSQSIYIHSHIETLYGVERLNAGGFWLYQPRTQRLGVYAKGLVNPWGLVWDRWGQTFATDGAGSEGINFVFPGAVFTTADDTTRIVKGLNPGSPKYCGLEIVESSNFPAEWQGNLITNDFRAHRVCRYVLSDDGSGFAAKEMPELIKSNHPAFRPVDVKMGPDGALYIADWYNPIIQHGEVDFRDERRDKTHGRIWRVTYKPNPVVKMPDLPNMKTAELLPLLDSPELWTREQARRVLIERGAEKVLPELDKWVETLPNETPEQGRALLEAAWLNKAINEESHQKTWRLIENKDPRVRAAAIRCFFDHGRPVRETHLGIGILVQVGIAHPHPRVRLEAVCALSKLLGPNSLPSVLAALEQPTDRFLDFAIWKSIRELKNDWLPDIWGNQNPFGLPEDRIHYLVYAFQAVADERTNEVIRELITQRDLSVEQITPLLSLLAAQGNATDLSWALERIGDEDTPSPQRLAVLQSIAQAAEKKKDVPKDAAKLIGKLINTREVPVQLSIARLIGLWKLAELEGTVLRWSNEPMTAVPVRLAAIRALGQLPGETAKEELRKMAASAEQYPFIRCEACLALADQNLPLAVEIAVDNIFFLLSASDDVQRLCAELQARTGAAAEFQKRLADKSLSADIARLGLRGARRMTTKSPELEAAWQKAGKLGQGQTYTPAEIQEILAAVKTSGEPARGELVYRRAELNCLKCHAIGGAGGAVGSDLRSLGASAPADYILDSLLNPSAKIKEGYNALIVEDDNGQTVSGVKIRENDQELVLRNNEDKEIIIPKSRIASRADSQLSLMPTGLTEELTRQELIDLTRFLSELGKNGPYSLGQRQLARRWQTPTPIPESFTLLNRQGVSVALDPRGPLQWSSVYTPVSGEAPLTDFTKQNFGANAEPVAFARAQIEVTTAGKLGLKIANPRGLRLWMGNQQEDFKGDVVTVILPVGTHTILVTANLNERTEPLSLEMLPVSGSAAQAQFVSGK